ncbi:uncharacterized protein TM35_000361240 [Trypanosoma theileri]|uniref:Uncharacterized protein n=1 Tax=Trypanosoma theileri TaxID=67003 RepID=A0A1X0NKG7_9TRYP|nr:uncharacterized protein TM35_000361240 [Trypanosoma theileri]ORC85264.1 hypothetical protein TM35_000361240 [Trypanosoma theileri]
MIPAINMSKIITDSGGKVGEHSTTNGNMDGGKSQQEIRPSTPLRSRTSTRNASRAVRDGSPHRTPRAGAATTTANTNTNIATNVEDGSSTADLRRRAEEVSSVLGVNILQVQDVFVLQCKAIEVAERMIRMEEWYNVQLQERSAYLEHRISQLAAGMGGQGTHGVGDKWVTPTTIRSRPSTGSAGTTLSRPTLSVTPTSSVRHPSAVSHAIHAAHTAHAASSVTSTPPAPPITVASHNTSGALSPNDTQTISYATHVNPRTPDSSRIRLSHHHSSPLASGAVHPPSRDVSILGHIPSRNSTTLRRQHKSTGGGGSITGSRTKATGTERRKVRSLSVTVGRISRGSSDAGVEETTDDVARRPKKRRSLGATVLLSMPTRNTTPKRVQPSTGRIGYSS